MSRAVVSVVVPTFNRAYCIAAALNSIRSQTWPEWEALVIDDGSTDDTESVVVELQQADPRIKYFRQSNRGVSAARNAGLDRASGSLIAFLDSDDAWRPWKLEAQMACLESLSSVGMVWTDMDAVDESGTVVARRYLRQMYGAYRWFGDDELFPQSAPAPVPAESRAVGAGLPPGALVRWGDLYAKMFAGNLVHTSTVLITRERLDKVGRFEEGYQTGEDYEFHLRTCRAGPVALLEASAVLYRRPGGLDQLTAPKYMNELAANSLRTRERVLAADRDRITLPRAMIREIMGESRGWFAEKLFDDGRYKESRPYFWRGWRYTLRSPRLALKAVLSLMPAWIPRLAMKVHRR